MCVCVCVCIDIYDNIYIYIYIYIYCNPQTYCFVVSQREMLKTGIENWLTLRQPDKITLQPTASPKPAREFNVYALTSLCLHFTLSETELFNSLEEHFITRAVLYIWHQLQLLRCVLPYGGLVCWLFV